MNDLQVTGNDIGNTCYAQRTLGSPGGKPQSRLILKERYSVKLPRRPKNNLGGDQRVFFAVVLLQNGFGQY